MRNGDYCGRVYYCGVVGSGGVAGAVGLIRFGTGAPGGAVGVPGEATGDRPTTGCDTERPNLVG